MAESPICGKAAHTASDVLDVLESIPKKHVKKRQRIDSATSSIEVPTAKKPKEAEIVQPKSLDESKAFLKVALDHYVGLSFSHPDGSSTDDIHLFANDLFQIRVVSPTDYGFSYVGSSALSHQLSNGFSVRITNGTKCTKVGKSTKYSFTTTGSAGMTLHC